MKTTLSNSQKEIDVTIFKAMNSENAYKRLKFDDWQRFIEFLYTSYNERCLTENDQNMHMQSGYNPSGRKLKGSIKESSLWFAMDFDDMQNHTIDTFLDFISNKGIEFVAYNSKSCRYNDPRMRVIVPLSRKVEDREYLHFWTNMRRFYGDLFDKQTNYIEKTQGFPSQYEKAYNFFTHNDGETIDVDGIKGLYPFIDMRTTILKIDGFSDYRLKKLTNRNIVWSGASDCPFVNKGLLSKFYTIYDSDGLGRHKLSYSIMVNIASNAVRNKYPITVDQIVDIMKDIDYNNIYRSRNWHKEAANALDHALSNTY